jgi:hypothetical protein
MGKWKGESCAVVHESSLGGRKGRLVSSVVNCFFCFAYKWGCGYFKPLYIDRLRENVLSCGLRREILDEYNPLALCLSFE